MGVTDRISEIIIRIISYYLLVSACCDIQLITCDIHTMIQRHNSNMQNSTASDAIPSNFNINATELEQHIMNGLNMKRKPDANLASISQEEFFTKYNEYLSKVNYRKKRSSKLYGDEITSIVFDDDDDFKRIFTFRHSNQSNANGSQRKRRSTRDEDITSLAFEIEDKRDLPTVIEQATLSVFLTNDHDHAKTPQSPPSSSGGSASDVDDDDSSSSSGSDLSPKKLTIKPNNKSHHHLRHHRSRVHVARNSQPLRLHVYQTDAHDGRTFLFSKELAVSSEDTQAAAFSQWIQLDLTSIVRTWLQGSEKVLGIDIFCEGCSKNGIFVVNDASHGGGSNNPALNVIGAVVRAKRKAQNRRKKPNGGQKQLQKHKKTHCRHNGESKCCRHEWTIDFKELGGYDYIIQPRHFDAGYCDGMCPFRHNMGSNHAYFQSLAHHQLKKDNVPNVCCAPTKLQDLEVLHIDENDHTKLKVTTMKKMMAMKCSCT